MAETIKDFLVGIGYKVDSGSEQKFKNSIEGATKGVLALAAVVATASAALTAAVTKIAAGFDDLYYASQRTKASAENIKAVGFAVSQLGGSYQGAVASIEAFALKVRSNPGYETLARSLGVVTRQNGNLRDTTALITDLSKALSKKPEYVRLQYLEAFGIDEATYKALSSGELVRYTEEYRRKQEALGVSQTRVAEIGKDLTNAWRSLAASAAAVGDRLVQSLGPGLKDFVDKVDAFLVRNADKIVLFFEKAAEWVDKLLTAFIQLVERGEGPLVEFFDKITTGVEKMQTAFTAFAAFLGGAFLLSVLGSFSKVGAGFAGLLLKLGIPAAAIGLGATATGYGPGAEFMRQQSGLPDTVHPDVRQTVGTAKAAQAVWGSIKEAWRNRPEVLGGTGGKSQASTTSISPEGRALLDTIASTEANSYNVIYGGQKFNSYDEHPRVNVPILSGPNAGRTSSAAGRYQFIGSTWDAQKRKLGLTDFSPASQDIAAFDLAKTVYRKKSGRDLDADLKSRDPTILSGIGSALAGTWTSLPGGIEQGQGSGRFVSSFNRFLERQQKAAETAAPLFNLSRFNGANDGGGLTAFDPAIARRLQANAALGTGALGLGQPVLVPPASNATNVDMNQKTEITILGGSDPQATAREVAGAQNSVNGGLTRNLQGAVR